jgi:MFS family permease
MTNRAIKDRKVTIDDVAAEASPAGKGSAQSPTIAAYVALILLFALYVLNWAHRQIISMFLEPIRHDMGLTDTQIGIFGGLAFTLFYAVAALPIASLSDRRSRPLILAICVGLWSLSLSATGFAKSFVHLLVTRALLGIGEAGFGPTANALVATYFPPPRLARAAAIFGAGASVGIFVAYGVGGWLLASVGWRKGLMLAGLPGILLSVIILLVLKDGRAERAHPPNRGSLMWAGMSAFFSSRALMFFITGAVLATMCDASIFFWYAPFMIRTHQIQVAELGWTMGFLIGMGQMAGILGGGFVGDYLSRRDIRWLAWVPGICCLMAALPAAVVYLTPSRSLATYLIAAPILLSVVYWAPMIVCLRLLAPNGLVATFIAMAYLLINGVGYGFGPVIIGSLSDILRQHFHDDSLRYALLITLPIYAAAALAYLLSSVFIGTEASNHARRKGSE